MSAARKPAPAPDMGGMDASMERLKRIRRDDEQQVADLDPPPEQQKQQGSTQHQEREQQGDEQHQEPEQQGEEQHKEPEQQAAAPARPGRSRGGRRPAPAAADAVPTTIRFDPEESSKVDHFVLDLRDQARRRSLDKSEVFRELIRLAQEHEPTKTALLKRLR